MSDDIIDLDAVRSAHMQRKFEEHVRLWREMAEGDGRTAVLDNLLESHIKCRDAGDAHLSMAYRVALRILEYAIEDPSE